MNFLSLHTHVGPILGSQIVAPSPDFGSARLLFTQLALLPQMVREPLPQPAINHYQSNLKTSLDDSSRVPIPTNDLPFSQDDLLSCRSLHLHRVDSSHGSPCLLFLLPQFFNPMLASHQALNPHPAAVELLRHWLTSTLINISNFIPSHAQQNLKPKVLMSFSN